MLNNGNTHPPALCAGEALDEKLKINKLGPYSPYDSTLKYGYISALQLIFEIISLWVLIITFYSV